MELSVIVPCHNESSTLGQQLDALSDQEWSRDWEVIVVDNASEDGTAAVARAHPLAGQRLRVIDAGERRGVAYARRAGVEASEAAAVVFVDGDDVVAPGWLTAIGDALLRHPLVTGEIDVELLNEPRVASSRGRRRLGQPPTFGSVVFLRGNNGGMWRTVWDSLDGFDEGFRGLEDIELSLRAAAMGIPVHFEPAALVHYRYRSGWGDLWRQGLFYGGSEPGLRRRCDELGITRPSRRAALRSWLWLGAFAPSLWRSEVRTRWVWTLACRIGAARSTMASVGRGWRVRRASGPVPG